MYFSTFILVFNFVLIQNHNFHKFKPLLEVMDLVKKLFYSHDCVMTIKGRFTCFVSIVMRNILVTPKDLVS